MQCLRKPDIRNLQRLRPLVVNSYHACNSITAGCFPRQFITRDGGLRVPKANPLLRRAFTSTATRRHGTTSRVSVPIDGKPADFSAIILRDACQCASCVHESTNQRLFSTADIPADITARKVHFDAESDSVNIKWQGDVHGFGREHTTQLSLADLRQLAGSGVSSVFPRENLEAQQLWTTDPLHLPDYDYDAYMKNDEKLYQLIKQLRTVGLAFVTNVPGTTEALATIATRIGPIKDTFYGQTWDVRTVPQASNAAFTSGDLGFHTDLLYFNNPPHIQLLHCVQSASEGGASVFADAYRAAVDLYHADEESFETLASIPANYHYNHPEDSNVYRTTKPVIDLRPLRRRGDDENGNGTTATTITNTGYHTRVRDYIEDELSSSPESSKEAVDSILCSLMDKINWGPPFLAPFSLHSHHNHHQTSTTNLLNEQVERWHAAAVKFNSFLQRPEYLYERKMDPGTCVLFDNTRTLHSRRAFTGEDTQAGKPRWLRGTYVDRDPYLSTLRVLRGRYGEGR